MRPLPAADLDERVQLALDRGAALLTESEREVAQTILDLPDALALAYARLTGRVVDVFRRPDLRLPGVNDEDEAVQGLLDLGLVTDEVSWDTRARHARRDVLAAACGRLGARRSGTRDALEARVLGSTDWDDASWVRVAHPALVLRLERWATLQVRPDRSAPVLERMGRTRWPPYVPTGGALVPSRAHWDRWEALVEGWATMELETAFDALSWDVWPPGRLDLRRALRHHVVEVASEREKVGAWTDAAAVYRRLLHEVDTTRGAWWVRLARCTERAGDTGASLALLREARGWVEGPGRIGLMRAGRRVARSRREAWAPDPPTPPPKLRDLKVAREDSDRSRPLYASPGGPVVIERAVSKRIEAAGRTVVRAEGPLWRALVGLLLAEVALSPCADQLPVPRLSGPLDGWTPAFSARRPAALFGLFEQVARGEGPARVGAAWDRFEGCRLSGVRWELATREQLVAIADGLGPDALAELLRVALVHGRRAFRGLPDLVVLPGPSARVDDVWPARLPTGLIAVEVKGEHDAVRDAQTWWFTKLQSMGVRVELWRA